MAELVARLDGLLEEAGLSRREVAGLGCSMAGMIDLESLSLASAAVVKAEIEACRETAGQSFANQNRYNVLHTSELEYFLEHASPEEVEEWVRLTKSGHFSLSPYHNLAMTAAQTLEEGIRQLYPARRLERRWGIAIGYANHQETPTITWSQAMVLAGSGIRHLVKSIYPYLCPWNDRLVEPPLHYWDGPDGSRILVRHRKNDYVEGRFILEGVEAIDTKIHHLPWLIFNRRRHTRNYGVWTHWVGIPQDQAYCPEGPVDPDFGLFVIRDGRHRPMCMIWNLTGHNSFHFGDQYSADLAHTVQEALDERMGEHVPCLYTPGCSGNTNYFDYGKPGGLEKATEGVASAIMAVQLETPCDPSIKLGCRREEMILPI